MRTLVTGGAGFIGSHVADALLAAGHQVLVLDNLSTGRRENVPGGATFLQADVSSPEVERAIADYAPAALFHHAAQTDVRRAAADPVFDANVNVLGTVRVASAATRAGAKVLVLASTGGALYGEQQRYPAHEEDAVRPLSPYGFSKACGEQYLALLSRTEHVRSVALRYANVYGPRQGGSSEAGVIGIFTQRILQGEPLTVYGDGRQTRDFVYVGDVVRANLRALDNEMARGAYNIGTGLETDINAIAHQLMAAAGRSVQTRHESMRACELRRSVIDPLHAKTELGWTPEITLRDGLARTLEWFRERA
jgi:UDP-glucose 4-epimerase